MDTDSAAEVLVSDGQLQTHHVQRLMQNNAVAGISISGPTSRMTDDRIAEFGEAVREAADRISIGLGAKSG